MIVSPLQESQLGELAQLFNQFRECYQQPSDQNSSYKYLLERFQKNESEIFIATEGEEIVGFIQLYPMYSSISLRKMFRFSDLYVKEEFRKRGIAMSLIEYAKDFAAKTQSMGLVIESRITNHAAERLYDSVGFKKEGEHLIYYIEFNN